MARTIVPLGNDAVKHKRNSLPDKIKIFTDCQLVRKVTSDIDS